VDEVVDPGDVVSTGSGSDCKSQIRSGFKSPHGFVDILRHPIIKLLCTGRQDLEIIISRQSKGLDHPEIFLLNGVSKPS
jgi:hypothetical protein